jgi:glycosyltransferase involved in cell wall biosynthesis
MKILQVHNRYTSPGGEDVVVREEAGLLEEAGHQVALFEARNFDEVPTGLLGQLDAGATSIWSRQSYRELSSMLEAQRPDVVHVHNTFSRLSASVLWAARAKGVPVVQTLHNYRLLCVNGLLLRNGGPCTDCLGSSPIHALRHRCYRGGVAASATIAAGNLVHHAAGTYDKVDRLVVKPNFVRAPEASAGTRRNRLIFVGRMAVEKGADVLLQAWKMAQTRDWTLTIIGDGPERARLQAEHPMDNVEWLGWKDHREVLNEVAGSKYLVMPSIWYETFGLTMIEAYAVGTPVIAADHGAMSEIVRSGITGHLFAANDPVSLSTVITRLVVDQGDWASMSSAAREEHARKYSPEPNIRQLLRIYEEAAGAQRR